MAEIWILTIWRHRLIPWITTAKYGLQSKSYSYNNIIIDNKRWVVWSNIYFVRAFSNKSQSTECPTIYRKSVLHLLKCIFALYLLKQMQYVLLLKISMKYRFCNIEIMYTVFWQLLEYFLFKKERKWEIFLIAYPFLLANVTNVQVRNE